MVYRETLYREEYKGFIGYVSCQVPRQCSYAGGDISKIVQRPSIGCWCVHVSKTSHDIYIFPFRQNGKHAVTIDSLCTHHIKRTVDAI